MRSSYEEQYRPSAVMALCDLHMEPGGKQILTMFKIDELLPYEPRCLESNRQLLDRHAKLLECASQQMALQ